MTDGPKFDVQLDASRNLVRVRFQGHVAPADTKGYVERVMSLLPQVRKGFTVLTDLSGLDSMELDCVTGLTKVMDAFRAKGVGTVVRIVPDPSKDIGFNILSVVHYRRGVKVITCQTAAEAERVI
jgi:hypothetical protein